MSKPEISNPITLNRTIKWIQKTDGRDKFCKAIQYACRFLKFRYEQRGQKQTAKKIEALFGGMRDARKLFRLFKSLNEYKKILDLIRKQGQRPEEFILNLITRIGFFFYWIFDNLAILSKIKVLSYETKPLSKKGATCWFIALFATFILTIKNLIVNSKKMLYLQKQIGKGQRMNQKFEEIAKLKKKQGELYLTLIKTVGDLIPSGQGSQIFPKLLGVNANEGVCGLGGLVSALISTYQLYD